METRFSPYKVYRNAQWQLTPQRKSNLVEFRTCPSSCACSRSLQVWKKSDQKWQRKPGDTIFPNINQWLLVAMVTTVLARHATKPDAAFLPAQWCYTWNLIKIGQVALEIYRFENVDDDRRRILGYTISSPLSPRLRWAKKSKQEYRTALLWVKVK